MDNQTQTYTILKNFERKVEALECSSCMLALTMMSMSLAVDARRLTKYFLIMLDGWRKCLPLGDACDVNFTTWGHNVWELMQKVRQVYSQNKVQLNVYEYNSASYQEFKNRLEAAEGNGKSMKALMMISGSEAGIMPDELLKLFNFIDTWRMMQSDMQTKKKQGEKAAAPVVDELEQKVKVLLDKIRHLTADNWKQQLPKLWKSIFTTFRSEISKAGSHEKFKEYSKKTLYCIIGHLKQKGAYKQISNLELTVTLEGMNNGMRKYLNSGLVELEQSLRERIELFVDQEMRRLVVVE